MLLNAARTRTSSSRANARDLPIKSNDKDSSPVVQVRNDASSEPDRLAHAKNFANELNESRLRKIKISYEKRWTKYRRDRKSVEIQTTKPWKQATGPKTAAGKACSSRNADKGKGRSAFDNFAKHTLRDQQKFLQSLLLAHRLRKSGIPGADLFWEDCLAFGQRVTIRLMILAAILDARYVTRRNNE